ncbi:adenosine deaminase-like [Hydractinia symbiolongicarpus]|uniref:adenosine deaminase-like n=1 Tax=Hydractinia symbiolongicarpus TaxID=13093 RepID=UPI00254ABFB7|nr:adenosine deaminase-like [Hydractinia symbiolongicarpus]XP_057314600.1 adenosine deaminase-like [Hydractinia symbiolongicarpus]XP_057314601.1 adenosine deaminase-like [Hydractinia symbiolongicarpus]
MEIKREQLYELLKSAPKPQLHLHLDGSLSYNFIRRSITRMKKTNPERASFLFSNDGWEPGSHDELRSWLMDLKEKQVGEGNVVEKNSNWRIFDICNQFLQTKEDLRDATYELVTSLHDEHNVNYIEIRFAPVLHTNLGLTELDAVWSVINGFNDAKKELTTKGRLTEGGVILCLLRSYPVQHAENILKIAQSVDGVLGIDIAGDEKTYSLCIFKDVLVAAKNAGIKITVHAGEGKAEKFPSMLENLQLALEIGVNRIGHALAITSASNQLIQEMCHKGISVEVCLTANCNHPDKCESFSQHPVNFMLSHNIPVAGLNCDNLLLSGNNIVGTPDPTNEYVRALLDCGVKPQDLAAIVANGYSHGFSQNSKQLADKSISLWTEKYLHELNALGF